MEGPLILDVPRAGPSDPAKLRWGIVSTVKASMAQVARFLAHHLDLGASRIHIHLDAPDPAMADRLAHPRVHFTQCDAAYWAGKPDRARDTHQMRQGFNASRVYKMTQLHWLAHFDVDEFLLPAAPVADLLAAADRAAPFVNVPLVEMMQADGATHWFKRQVHGTVKREIFPTYGAYVPGGFLSTLSPKIIVRTGLANPIRLGIHAVRHKGRIARNGIEIPDLALGHAHAPDFETFQRHLAYRLDKGSYHNRKGRDNPLGLLIRALMDDPDRDALRAFHAELSQATPQRRALLARHDKLIGADLDLDTKVARHFGPLEPAA